MATQEQIEGYVAFPSETMTVEHKRWLDLNDREGRATLAKAAMALANSGGGVIVVGFRENVEAGRLLESEERPANIRRYGSDDVNNAVKRYAKPSFHCEIGYAVHPATGVEHVVVSVPGDHRVPVMVASDCVGVIAQNKVYIRKPGPESAEITTPEEWSALLERCVRARKDDMLDAIRAIVTGSAGTLVPPAALDDPMVTFIDRAETRWNALVADMPVDAPARFPHGGFSFAMAFVGDFDVPALADLARRIGNAHGIRLTGWPVFINLNRPPHAPVPGDGVVEAWLGHDGPDQMFPGPAHQDFWWISPDGLLYTKRGYYEDEPEVRAHEPGTAFDFIHPIWRTAEALLFARRLADQFGSVGAIRFRFRWNGLQGRRVVVLDPRRWFMGDYVCRGVDEISVEGSATLNEIDDNLAEVLQPALARLYEAFDFLDVNQQSVAEEVARLRERRF